MRKVTLSGLLLLCCSLSMPAFSATINIQNGGDPTSLDPHKLSGDWENRIAGDIFEGLVTDDINAQPIPGQAESWTISDDGLVYTFTLRDGIVWTDGTPVTAGDFVFSFQRLMDPETAAEYAYLQYPIKNAEAINSGENTDIDSLGVVAIDDKTLEITVEQPTPYFIGGLTHYTAFPIPKHVIDAKGDDWVKVENIATNGPYKPTEWIPGSHVSTVKNEAHYDAANTKIDGAKFFVLEDQSAALKRFRAGEFDILTSFPTDCITTLSIIKSRRLTIQMYEKHSRCLLTVKSSVRKFWEPAKYLPIPGYHQAWPIMENRQKSIGRICHTLKK